MKLKHQLIEFRYVGVGVFWPSLQNRPSIFGGIFLITWGQRLTNNAAVWMTVFWFTSHKSENHRNRNQFEAVRWGCSVNNEKRNPPKTVYGWHRLLLQTEQRANPELSLMHYQYITEETVFLGRIYNNPDVIALEPWPLQIPAAAVFGYSLLPPKI